MGTKNLTPGMDKAQIDADRKGFRTTVQNVTGGETMDLGDDSGPEVGNAYGNDPMGEERSNITFVTEDKTAKG